jgi:Icc-related predicted phosphoesterase
MSKKQMKIQLMSDLHLESHDDSVFKKNHLESQDDSVSIYEPRIDKDVDVLILAGDISDCKGARKFILSILNKHKNLIIVYVFGNHEYFNSSLEEVRHFWSEQIKHQENGNDNKDSNDTKDNNDTKNGKDYIHNLYILDNGSLILNNIRFIGATLWTDYNQTNKQHHQLNILNNPHLMSEREMIIGDDYFKNNEKIYTDKNQICKVSVKTILHECINSINCIQQALSKKDDFVNIIITHHLPSYKSVSDKYYGSSKNVNYASHLDWLIEKYQPYMWCHGHTHDPCDYYIGKTKILCNPKGYFHEQDNNFNEKLTFII